VIVFLTGSVLVLSLGIVGVLGAYFWTARPVKLCYRFLGEPFIFILFGPLPVLGSYYLQTGRVDINPLIPGIIVGLIIAMVLEINTFPDRKADAAVNKRTFVVRFGPKAGVVFYRASISATYLMAVAGLFGEGPVFWGSAAYLTTFPIGLAAIKRADVKRLTEHAHVAANKLTIIYHSVAGVLMSAAFVAFSFVNR
ncbi:MAG: prenyltransferase, partial [Candidatus Brocadiia bacterium]